MKIIFPIIVFLLGFFAGTYFGFNKAPEEFLYWNSQFNAAVLANELEILKTDHAIGSISSLKESELNSELSNYGRYLDSDYNWVFPLITGIDRDLKYINSAVNYRLKNPYSDPEISSSDGWVSPNKPKTKDLIKKVIEGQKENQELLEKVLEIHASK